MLIWASCSPPGRSFNHLLLKPQDLVVPGRVPESIQNSNLFPGHSQTTKMLPKAQKAPKMRSQSVPEHPQITNKPKKWNLMKTPRLPWFKHIRASDSGVISTPKSLKNLPWNPYCHFVACKHEKVTKMAPKRVPGGTQNRQKIDKNLHLDPEVPS